MSPIKYDARRRANRQAERYGSDVRNARADRGLTLKQVAHRAGVSPDTARRVERGDPGAELDTLCAVGAAVGLDLVLQAYPGALPSLRGSLAATTRPSAAAAIAPAWPIISLQAGTVRN